ncbi:unnamed protein product [Aureobasidium vineae]|uniref:Uncharacterized protein n=1 Tax=Aureobasidium vineae TaxID=2773715 RepID=A0A9N8P908_9PEZI|nr:unnamed protein product [Aureobasidium vineae]
MALASLKRQLSRVLARDTTTNGTSSCDAPELPSDAQVDEQCQRASPKASIYKHSPAHSGTTLHDLNQAPTNVSPEYLSDAMVHVMTVGDSIITIETQQRDAEQGEQPAVKRRKKSFGLRRVKTEPASQSTPLHGSITTIESVPNGSRSRAWSYPLVNWKNLSLVRRMRRSADLKEARKEARKGKASCELVPGDQPQTGDADENTTAHLAPLMPGAVQGSPSHINRLSNGLDASPRASVNLGIGASAPGQDKESSKKHSNSSSEEQIKRKDSRFHEVMQAGEKAAADMEANTREVAFEERPQKNSAFLLHPIDWIRQHHATVFPLPSSDSSSDSDSRPPSPTTRPARPARRTQEPHPVQPQATRRRGSEALTRDELYMRSRINLPPGMDIPAVGQAGPVDWLHRGWEEHYRQLAESSRRACHPLAAACFLPTRGEEMQRYVPGSQCQNGRGRASTQRGQSTPYPTGVYIQTCDFAVHGKGKGIMYVQDVGAQDGRGRRENRNAAFPEYERQRRIEEGACVTTLTLGECNFAKELGQNASQDSIST